MRKKFLKRLVAIATVATLAVGSISTAYGREYTRGKDFIRHHHNDEVTELSDGSQLGDGTSSNQQNETSLEPVDVVYENFELGNTTSKILKGGLCASYEELDYYAQNDGLLLVGEDREGIITTDVVTDINVMEDTLYYVTVQDGKFIIKKSDLYCEESEIICESDGEIEMMYVINNEEIVYLVENNIYKLDITTGEKTTLYEDTNITSFIPTQYGLILGSDVADGTVLSINGRELFEAQNFYTEDDYLIYDYEYETKQVALTDLFKTRFNRDEHEKEFDLHGKFDVFEILASEEEHICDENCIVEETDNAQSRLASAGISTYSSLATASNTSTYSTRSTDTYYTETLSNGQYGIIKRARQMVEIEWTPLKNVTGWKGKTTFYAGTEYVGVPYGQCSNRGDWIGYEISLDEFADEVKNSNSLLYTNYALSKDNYIAPYYSNDCSTFLSYCWNLPDRYATSELEKYVTMTKITDSDATVLQSGDCLNSVSNGHVVLVLARIFDETGNLSGYYIAEQTPNRAVIKSRSIEYIKSNYIDNDYIAYRYDNRYYVSYTHSCSVPIDGDTCAECNYNPSVASTMKISSYNSPSTLYKGDSFSIYGEVTSNYFITNVTVGVYTMSGTPVITASDTMKTKSYNVKNLDAKLKFGSLEEGYYIYKIFATDRQGTKYLVGNTFYVTTPPSTLSISSYTYPTSLTEGQSFSVKGAITSNYTISNVTVRVRSSSGTSYISVSASPNAKSYNISSLDSKIKFGILSKGTYIYEVIATDTKGTETLLSKSFTVANSTVASTLTVNSHTYPSSITQGSSFSLKGTVTSNYYIKNVTIGVYTTAGSSVMTASATPYSKSYSISNLDAKITFGKLAKGVYVYKIIATDVKGTKTLFSYNFTVR